MTKRGNDLELTATDRIAKKSKLTNESSDQQDGPLNLSFSCGGGSGKRYCKSRACALCRGRSFAGFHDKKKVACWIKAKNDGMDPWQVAKHNGKKFWFRCDTCPHDFESMLGSITREKGS